ncbi:hypothetical protein DL96DRAFT_1558638 [Flagelloscypha sp. PMI_526]|nr:hypothetical protein DL96DRAFT_1558638 [Flagelloscypha sp. PMI_526]
MSLLDDIIGAILIGTWTNSVLLAYEANMAYKYFKKCRNDRALTRWAVAFLLVLDVATSLFEYVTVYMYAVTEWGSKEFLAKQPWTLPPYAVTTELAALVVQIYLISRFWRLARNIPVTIMLVTLSLSGFAGNAWVTYGLIKYPGYAQRTMLKDSAILWYTSVVGADISIAVALAVSLQRMRQEVLRSTKTLLQGLTYGAISTGSITAFFALLNMILYLRWPETNWGPLICFNIGRIYTLTMLYNLTHRSTNAVSISSSRDAESILDFQSVEKTSTLETLLQSTSMGLDALVWIGTHGCCHNYTYSMTENGGNIPGVNLSKFIQH